MKNFLKHPPKDDWRRKAYVAEKHRPKELKYRESTASSDPNFTWKTGIIIYLIVSSRLPLTTAAKPRNTNGVANVGNNSTNDLSATLLTRMMFDSNVVENVVKQSAGKPSKPKGNKQQRNKQKSQAKKKKQSSIQTQQARKQQPNKQTQQSKKQQPSKQTQQAKTKQSPHNNQQQGADHKQGADKNLAAINNEIICSAPDSSLNETSIVDSSVAYTPSFFSNTHPVCKIQKEESPVKQDADSNVETIKSIIVGDFTPQQQNAVADKIVNLRKTNPDIKFMIDTVLEHNPNVRILLAPLSGIKKLSITGFNAGGFYDPRVQSIVLPANATAGDLLHELRHAFWHTFHIANSPHQLTTVCKIGHRKAWPQDDDMLEKFIKIGDARIKKLLDLINQEPEERSLNLELRQLKDVRKLLASSYEHYTPIYRSFMLVTDDEENCKTYTRGSTFSDDRNYRVQSCEEVSSLSAADTLGYVIPDSDHTMTYLKLLTDDPDPLQNLLTQVLTTIGQVNKYYRPESRLYEREAFLYGILPIPLLEYLYPELLNYTRSITQSIVVKQTPFAKYQLTMNIFSQYHDISLRQVDMEFISQCHPEDQVTVAAMQAGVLWDAGDKYAEQLRPILKFLLSMKYEMEETANRLIELYHRNGDHKKIVDTANYVNKHFGKWGATWLTLQMQIISHYKIGQIDKACKLTVSFLKSLTSSFEKLIQQNGKETVMEHKKFCEDMIRAAGCRK